MLRYIYSFVLSLGSLATFSQDPAPKTAIPDDAAQKAALAVVADVYKSDYEKAKTPAQKLELAKKLLGEGIATKDDSVSRFVLFRIARDIAAQQGDLVTAFDAIGRIGIEYDADALQMKVDAATTATKALKLPKDHQACAVFLAPLIDEAIAVDRYDHAKSLAALTLGSAREGRDFDRIKQMVAKLKEVEEVAAESEKVKVAKDTLEAKPTDADANLAVGKFLCLFKGDWKRGVTMLALGSNEDFKATAMLELEEKPDALKLGDGWWKASESLEGTAKTRTQSHAGEWYRKALPGLSGLTKARVESRLKDIGEVDVSVATDDALRKILLSQATWQWDYYSPKAKGRRLIPLSFRGDGSVAEPFGKFAWKLEKGLLYTTQHGYFRFNQELRQWENTNNSADDPSKNAFLRPKP